MLIGSDWTNVLNPLNTSGDAAGLVAPNDVLVVINEINRRGVSDPRTGQLQVVGENGVGPPPFHDVNCDSLAAPNDVLEIINFLNGVRPRPGWRFGQTGGNGEGIGNFSNDSCGALLHEGNSFVTSLTSSFTVPDGATAVSFAFDNLSFDESSQGAVRDAFEAALLDRSERSVVKQLDVGGDAYFNISEGFTAATTGEAEQTDDRVTLSLANVLPGSEVQLVVRLVNNDGDTDSSVLIRSVQIEFEPAGSGEGAAGGTTSSPAFNAASGDSALSPNLALRTSLTPPAGAIAGRAPAAFANEATLETTDNLTATGSGESNATVIDSRGTEFWIGFPDNLHEGGNTPQKAVHITGDLATTGFVEIPGLIDPSTSEPFRAEFAVNPGTVTAVELPSEDAGDAAADDQTDFDVEAELIAAVQQRGVHIVAEDPVTVYGINRAVNTTDAFLALPVDSLGTEYVSLGYENTFAGISSVEGTQFLVVASENDTRVDIVPSNTTFSSQNSLAEINRPSGTTGLGLTNAQGTDMGPTLLNESGEYTISVQPPFAGYAGTYRFELIDLESAAQPIVLEEISTASLATGREAKVFSFDVAQGQHIYIDYFSQQIVPKVLLVSPSGAQTVQNIAADGSPFQSNGPLRLTEAGRHYLLIVGEEDSPFDFSFRLMDVDAAPTLALNSDIVGTFDPPGQADVYQFQGTAGQRLYYDAFLADRNVHTTLYAPGGHPILRRAASDDAGTFVLPVTGTYHLVAFASGVAVSSYGFRLMDIADLPLLPIAAPIDESFADGKANLYRIDAGPAQTAMIEYQSVSNVFRTDIQVLDPVGSVAASDVNSADFQAPLAIGGEYVLLVDGTAVNDSGDVTFSVTINDDATVAKSGFNSTQTLSIGPGEIASYQFSAPAGTPFFVDSLDSANENLNVELTDPNGARIFTGIFPAAEQRDIPLTPRPGPSFLPLSGTYTLTLRGNTPAASGDYPFRVLDLETAATPMELDTIVSGTLPTGREAVIFSFEATAGDYYNFNGLAASSASTYLTRVLDGTLQPVFLSGSSEAPPNADGPFFTGQGKHYVVVRGNQDGPVDYDFQIQNVTAAPTVNLSDIVSGTISPGRSQQLFRIDLSAGQRLFIDGLDDDNERGVLRIRRPGGTPFYSGASNQNGDSSDFLFLTVPESGEYLITLEGDDDADTDFQFRMIDVDAAPPLNFDVDVDVLLPAGREAEFFRIDGKAAQTLDFDNLSSTGTLYWRLNDPAGRAVAGDNNGLDFSARALANGTYYLGILGRSNSASSLSFRATRTDDAAVVSSGFNAEFTLDVPINGHGTHAFDAPAGRLVFLNVMESRFAIPEQSVTLNEGETYLVRDLRGATFGFGPDLSGSVITSDKPIAVFGGNRAAFVPSTFFAADHLVEQLPPTNTWGSEFVTVPLETGTTIGDRLRFLAQIDGTEVSVNGEVVATLNRGEVHEQVFTDPAHIKSNGSILVAQYAHSQNFYRQTNGGDPEFSGDPLMILIPPLEQFLSNYTVSTPAEDSIPESERFDRNFVNVLARTDAVGQIEVDGAAIDAGMFVPIGDSGFSGAKVPITLGSYELAGPLPFGALVYGFGSFDSYGYTGGQALTPVADVASVVLNPETANPALNESLAFTARVGDDTGAPIEGIRVDFDVAGVNPRGGFGFSDAAGLAQFSYVGTEFGRDVVTASVGQLLDDSIIDWRTNAAPPQITVTSPLDGTSVPAGTTLVATGFAIADFPNATLDLVTVNGVPIESVDAAGNYFVSLFVGPGENEFEFTAIDSSSQVGSQIITISGDQLNGSEVDFTQFADVSGSFDVTYARTSYDLGRRELHAETAVENVGQFPADVPLLVGVTNVSDPRVLVRHADGETPDGIPYYDFTGLVTGGSLNPRGQSGFLSAAFYNPNEAQFSYDLVFFGKLNEPPQFTSLPPTETDLGREYRYEVVAVDPNGERVTFELLEGPASMSIDGGTGLIRWTPGDGDAGVHSVAVRVSDERLGVSTQSFAITARPAPPNRAPVFTSFPIGLAEVGTDYAYGAEAIDTEGDALSFCLMSGPAGMTIDGKSGQISWRPSAQQLGQHKVVLEVTDGNGGFSRQSYSLLVISAADNLEPMIVSTPPAAAKLGAINYQIIAQDADSEPLTYTLLDGPIPMAIDDAGLISWTSTTGDLGTHQVVVEVVDPRGGRDVQDFTLTVFDNEDPTITSQPVTSAAVGGDYSYQVTADDAQGDSLSFSLPDAPAAMTIDSAGGLISWSVTEEAYEQEQVTVRVVDGRGGSAEQQFTIQVGNGQSLALNVNPFFVSVPPTVASVGTTLLYPVQARDPNGDSLTFDLPLGPDGMVIDQATGLLGWHPRADQAGTHQVVIRAMDGNNAGIWLQSLQIEVDSANTAPVITSTPKASATVGSPWEYRIQVQDADNDGLTFELLSAAAGQTVMALENAEADAVVRFTPDTVGTTEVTLAVSDGRGGVAEQRFSIDVAGASANVAPIVDSDPRLSIAAGRQWVYLVNAHDPNADPMDITLTAAPAGMVYDAGMRMVSWRPTLDQVGPHSVTLTLADGRGGTTEQSFTVEVTAAHENSRPRIVSPPSAFRATVGEPVAYDLRAADDDGDPVEWTIAEAPHGTSLDPRSGKLRWTPSLDQLGTQRFIVSATDPAGQEAMQSFSLIVSGANLAPIILSRAPSEAAVDERYVYGVRAVDPESDPLVFSLAEKPDGMTLDAERGILRWTPTSGQTGTATATIEVTDSQGNSSSQTFSMGVTEIVRNQSPSITSRAVFRARVDSVYEYDVQAVDPEADPITYSLVDAPDGMQIDTDSGLITWTPTSDQAAAHIVRVSAADTEGNVSVQRFAVLARVNQAPVITSEPLGTVSLGGTYRYDVQVEDPEGDAVRFELLEGPSGMAIDELGRIVWQTKPGVPLSDQVRISATDSFGASATQTYTLEVTPDSTAPIVELQLTANPLVLGEDTVALVQATDDVGVAEVTLIVDGVPQVLDGDNTFTLRGDAAGQFNLQAAARDAAGNEGVAEVTLRVFDPADTQGPTITITSPESNSVVTTLTDIVGSVTDDNLNSYRVDYARADLVDVNQPAADDPDYKILAASDSGVADTILATFDPTLLDNDAYVLRVWADDLSGNVSAQTITLGVSGELKFGQLAFVLTDLNVSLAGIPITIEREYDSRNADTVSDFGHGWSLRARQATIRESVPVNPLEAQGMFFAATPFRAGDRVYLTEPDGRRVGFTFAPQRQFSLFGGGSWMPSFDPDPGVRSRLEVPPTPLQQVDGAFSISLLGYPYNPSVYRLRTPDGLTYEYNQFTGLEQVDNRNGVSLRYTADGVFSSTGTAVRFLRDPLGRIASVIDPVGNALQYTYDTSGNLSVSRNQVGLPTTYVYLDSPAHLLKSIKDANDETVYEIQYDSSGRVVATGDVLGNTVINDFDLENLIETTTDPLGLQTHTQFDEQGNVLAVTNPLGVTTSFTYDQNGNLLTATDGEGNQLSREYDGRGNVAKVTDPLGATTVITYTDDAQIASTTTGLGQVTTLDYDALGNLVSVVNALGFVSRIERDNLGRATRTMDNMENVVQFGYGEGPRPTQVDYLARQGAGQPTVVLATERFTYDSFGQVTEKTDENGNATQYTYDSLGRLLTESEPTGGVTRYEYDGQLLGRVIDPLNRVTRFEYDAFGRRTTIVDPMGGTTRLSYDANNRPIESIDPLQNATRLAYRSDGLIETVTGPLGETTTYEYGDSGNRTAAIDANGHRTEYEYDRFGQLVLERDPLGGEQTYRYDMVGNLVAIVDPRGNETQFRYDSLGQRIATIDALGQTSRFDYDASGRLVGVVDANGNRTQYIFDERERLVGIEDPAGRETRFEYDRAGNLARQIDPLGQTTSFEYDESGRLVAQTNALSGVARFEYDLAGNLVAAEDAEQRRTEFEYDELDRVTRVTRSDVETNLFSYDAVGNRTSVTDALGNETRFEFDPYGRTARRIDALGAESLSEYDAIGNRIRTVDRLGRVREFSYDALDRLVNESWYENGQPVRSLDFTFDAAGNLLTAADAASALTWTYDVLNRPASTTNAGTPQVPATTLQYTYDAVGNTLAVEDQSGIRAASAYDASNRIVTRSWSGFESDGVQAKWDYDPRGSMTSLRRYKGPDLDSLVGSTDYVLDALGRVETLTHRDPVGAVMTEYEYAYDQVGQLLSETVRGNETQYAYDDLGQLLQVKQAGQTVESFSYDLQGNRQGSSIFRDAANRILADDQFDYVYDQEGNLVRRTDRASGESLLMEYDFRNRLITMESRSDQGNLLSRTEYAYDALDRRIVAAVDGQHTATVYDGDTPWADFDRSGQVTARYLSAPAVDSLLARWRPGEGVAWYLADRLNTVRDLADHDGQLLNHIDYDAFGGVKGETNPEAGDRFRFTGREWDAATGFYYYRARYYDPRHGRFLSEDPNGFAAGDTNLYRYVGNSPQNATDPSGRQALVAGTSVLEFSNIVTEAALSYGKDTPFQFQIRCQGTDCGISGSLPEGAPLPKLPSISTPIPGLKVGLDEKGNPKISLSGKIGKIGGKPVELKGFKVEFGKKGPKVEIEPEQLGGFSIELNEKGVPTLKFPKPTPFEFEFEPDEDPESLPAKPSDAEFSFLVESVAKSPHLVISFNVAIFAALATELELIAKVVEAQDIVDTVHAGYEKGIANPKASVATRGFARPGAFRR